MRVPSTRTALIVIAALVATGCGTATSDPSSAPSGRRAPDGFGQSYQEIVRLARQETASGPVRMCGGGNNATTTNQAAAFKERYPDIPLEWARCSGGGATQKILLELRANVVSFDTITIGPSDFEDFLSEKALAGTFDYAALGFPDEYGIAGRRTDIAGASLGMWGLRDTLTPALVYNVDKVPLERRPTTLADCADPYWRGKVVADTEPTNLSWLGLPEFWGEERMVAWGAKLAANAPIWMRGEGLMRAQLLAGDIVFACGVDPVNVYRDVVSAGAPVAVVIPKDINGKVAARPGNPRVVLQKSTKPNAALLVSVFMASALSHAVTLRQKDSAFYSLSPDVPGSFKNTLHKDEGLQLVDVDQDLRAQMTPKLIEAYGFPKGRTR